MKRLMITVGLMALCAASAQIRPTTSPNTPDAINKGPDSAQVTQEVQLIIPKATALHLDTKTLVFDMTQLNGSGWADRARSGAPVDFGGTMECVYGLSEQDVKFTDTGSDFYDQDMTSPLGTDYAPDEDRGWPYIKVRGGGHVNTYPPIRLDSSGKLVPGSKNHFVCYRSFIIQKFSNAPAFEFSVQRNDTTGQGIEHLYIQDNPCDTFGATTGLYDLPNNASRQLIPKNLQYGPTGTRSAANFPRCGYKSWLDDLVVVAVKVNADKFGTNTANLTYTLTSIGSW